MSKSLAPSTYRVSRALSLISSSSNVSRASLIASSTSLASLVSSTSSIASIKKVQLKILSQLYVIRSQDLSFLHKNDPLYGLPQNRQLRKTTAASPPKSITTISTVIPPPPVEPNTPEAPPVKSTVGSTVNVPEVKPVDPVPVPVESSAPRALDSTVGTPETIDTPDVIPVEPTLLKLSTLELP
jgi:hypothetical protein